MNVVFRCLPHTAGDHSIAIGRYDIHPVSADVVNIYRLVHSQSNELRMVVMQQYPNRSHPLFREVDRKHRYAGLC